MKKKIVLIVIVALSFTGLVAQGLYIDAWPSILRLSETDYFGDSKASYYGITGKIGIPMFREPLSIIGLEYAIDFVKMSDSDNDFSFNSFFLAPSFIYYFLPDFQAAFSPGRAFTTGDIDNYSRFQYTASIAYDIGETHGLVLGWRVLGIVESDFSMIESGFFIRYRFKRI